MNIFTFQYIFLFFLIGATLLSFYLFIDVLLFKNKTNAYLFNVWQFPMILAVTAEVIYYDIL
jgi:hypothetical protein